jgi:U6 snRNA-associated Sm-like protein LSm6
MENNTNATASGGLDSKDPSAFLSDIIGVPVTVKLNSGVVYKGTQFSCMRSMTLMTRRRAAVSGRVYEYRAGEVPGVCQWAVEKNLWGCVC